VSAVQRIVSWRRTATLQDVSDPANGRAPSPATSTCSTSLDLLAAGRAACLWMALIPDGTHLLVTVGRANEIAVIDTVTTTVTTRISTGRLPWGIVVVDVP
jgi:YVTN family beta-propeller protein